MVPELIWVPGNLGPKNLVPYKFGSCMKIIIQHFNAEPKFLGDQISRGPNFLGTKKVRGPNKIGTISAIGSCINYISFKSFKIFSYAHPWIRHQVPTLSPSKGHQ